MAIEDDIRTAITGKIVLAFSYRRRPRLVHPHALIRSYNGDQLLLHAWQADGESNSRNPPCWANFRLNEIGNLIVTDDRFTGAQAGFNPTHFRHVLAAL
jgi:hypothetical protein